MVPNPIGKCLQYVFQLLFSSVVFVHINISSLNNFSSEDVTFIVLPYSLTHRMFQDAYREGGRMELLCLQFLLLFSLFPSFFVQSTAQLCSTFFYIPGYLYTYFFLCHSSCRKKMNTTSSLRIEDKLFNALLDLSSTSPMPNVNTSIRVEKIRAFLTETKGAIDFTVVNSTGYSFLHLIASSVYVSEDDDAAAILLLLCERIERHPSDLIDWGQRGVGGSEFIVAAAQHQRLSVFYPIVKDMPYFGDQTTPIPLRIVWRWDWEALGEENQREFRLPPPGQVLEASRATGRLWAQLYKKAPDAATIAACVADGADVLFRMRSFLAPVLLQCAHGLDKACVLACLRTHQPLCCTNVGREGASLDGLKREMLSNVKMSEEDVEEVLAAIREHTRQYPPPTQDIPFFR